MTKNQVRKMHYHAEAKARAKLVEEVRWLALERREVRLGQAGAARRDSASGSVTIRKLSSSSAL